MSRLQTNAIRHLGSAVDNLTMDNAGRVLMPNQPAFNAYKNNNAIGGAVISGYLGANFNVGGHFNTSTGVFTAPVGGKYWVYAQLLAQNGVVDNSVEIQINGVQYATVYENTSGWNNLSFGGLLQLNAGDAVRVYTYDGIYSSATNWIRFMGHLVG
jgi:hypothetical protein